MSNNIKGLDDYLAKTISSGPKAKKGKIYYYYTISDNIDAFMMLLLKKEKHKYGDLCIPQFRMYEEKGEIYDLNSLKYYIDNDTLKFSPDSKQEYYKCINNKTNSYVFTKLVLSSSKLKMSHMNMLFIDLKNKTIERFEPHGSFTSNYIWFYDDFKKHNELEKAEKAYKKALGIENNINNSISKNLSLIGLEGFTFIPPSAFSPMFGPQQFYSDSYNGMCVTFSLMYLHLRILNKNKTPKQIVSYMVNLEPIKLKKIILKYAKYVEESLKKDEKISLNLIDRAIEFIDNFIKKLRPKRQLYIKYEKREKRKLKRSKKKYPETNKKLIFKLSRINIEQHLNK